MQHSPALAALIDALRALPGVGPKSAQRMAFHLLQDARPAAQNLSAALQRALERVGRCRQCRMLTEAGLCEICANPGRDAALLCVVESPADVVAIEQSGGYRGRYFVLMGHLSPLDGIGAKSFWRPTPRSKAKPRRIFCRSWCISADCGPAASRTACRWAANSNTSMRARWRTPWRAGTRSDPRGPPDGGPVVWWPQRRE
jgi:hypothetical protein